MSSSTWQEHFKDKLVGLERPREGSYLELALLEGRISEPEYLAWATDAFLLPVLNNGFFTDRTPDAELLNHVRHPWSSVLFPISRWDGHLIVACLEKPASVPAGVSLVLASREAMARWWEQVAPMASSNDAPDGIDLSADSGPAIDGMEGLLGESPASASSAPAPSGLNFSGISLVKNDAPSAQENVVASFEPPREESLDSIALEPVAAEPVIQRPANPPPVTHEPQMVSQPVFSSSSEPEAASPGFDEITGTKTFITLAADPVPAAPKKPIPIASSNTQEKHLMSTVVSNLPSFKTDVQHALTQISGCFEKTMFLMLNELSTQLLPIYWSETFGKGPPPNGNIPLGTASLFQIVYTTEKPFHGPIVSNDINNAFFKAWNHDIKPDHVTVVPFFFKNRIVGMLLGVGSESSYTLPILRHAEKASTDLTRKSGGAASGAIAA